MRESFWRRHGALSILVVLFLGSWAGQLVAQGFEVAAESAEHGQPQSWVQTMGSADFWWQFLSATLENWQSEWLQLATQTLLLLYVSSKINRFGEGQERETMKQAVREVLAERDGPQES